MATHLAGAGNHLYIMQNSEQKSFMIGPVEVSYGLFAIKIRNGFRTAHTFTTQRNNFIVRVSYAGLQGSG